MDCVEKNISDGATDGEVETTKQYEKTKHYETETYTITAYCACVKCCGKTDGITATGTKATEGRTIAVDPNKIPYGTEVNIEGVGVRVAEDCGGAIKGNRIDIYFNDHQSALNFGRQTKEVTILN